MLPFPHGVADEPDGDEPLRVNERFSQTLAARAARSIASKRLEAAALAPLPAAVVRALVSAVAGGLDTLTGGAAAAAIARAVVDAKRLQLSAPALAALESAGGTVDVAAALPPGAVDGATARPDVRAALRGAFQWVKKTATMRRAERRVAAASSRAPADEARDAAPPRVAKRLRDALEPAHAAPPRRRDALIAAPSAVPPAEPTALTSRVVAASSRSAHVHGRGAGAGRGLDHHGEPPFADMHASWQAARRLLRPQRKAVARALRPVPVGGDAGAAPARADAPGPVDRAPSGGRWFASD